MTVGDCNLAQITIGLIRPGNAEVGGIDMDAVGTEIGGKKAFRHDLVE